MHCCCFLVVTGNCVSFLYITVNSEVLVTFAAETHSPFLVVVERARRTRVIMRLPAGGQDQTARAHFWTEREEEWKDHVLLVDNPPTGGAHLVKGGLLVLGHYSATSTLSRPVLIHCSGSGASVGIRRRFSSETATLLRQPCTLVQLIRAHPKSPCTRLFLFLHSLDLWTMPGATTCGIRDENGMYVH